MFLPPHGWKESFLLSHDHLNPFYIVESPHCNNPKIHYLEWAKQNMLKKQKQKQIWARGVAQW